MDPTKDEMENNDHVQKRNELWHDEEPKSEKMQFNLNILLIFQHTKCMSE